MVNVTDIERSMAVLWRTIQDQQIRVLEMEVNNCNFKDIEKIRERTRKAKQDYFELKKQLKELAHNKNKFSKN